MLLTVELIQIRFRPKKLIFCLASSALTLKICVHIPFLLGICRILLFSLSKMAYRWHCIPAGDSDVDLYSEILSQLDNGLPTHDKLLGAKK